MFVVSRQNFVINLPQLFKKDKKTINFELKLLTISMNNIKLNEFTLQHLNSDGKFKTAFSKNFFCSKDGGRLPLLYVARLLGRRT